MLCMQTLYMEVRKEKIKGTNFDTIDLPKTQFHMYDSPLYFEPYNMWERGFLWQHKVLFC